MVATKSVFLATVLLGVALPTTARAQATVRIERVQDSTGAPIVPSRVDVEGTRLFALGDTLGRVIISQVPLGHQILRIRGLGYSERLVEIDVRGDTLRLEPVTLRRNGILDSVRIVAF